jgi:Rhodopirellula transposase DDE domain
MAPALETVRYYISKTETTTGLTVQVGILTEVYQTGRKCAAGFKESMKIVFDKILPKWNYTAIPEPV